MKLPIVYDLDGNNIILIQEKPDSEYILLTGMCKAELGSTFELCPMNPEHSEEDSIIKRSDFKEFKSCLEYEIEKTEELNKFEKSALKQLREMLDNCPDKNSTIAESLKKQIEDIEYSFIPHYDWAEKIILKAMRNANCFYDPILEDVVDYGNFELALEDFKKSSVQKGDFLVRISEDNREIEYIVFDKFEDNYICYQYRRIFSLNAEDGCYNSTYFSKTILDLGKFRYCNKILNFVNDIDIRDGIPAFAEHDKIVIGYKRDIEKFKSECQKFEPKDEHIYRADINGRSALIEFNANWRSEKRYNVILYTDDFSIVYPKDTLIELKPENLTREANDYEWSAFKAIINEFTGQLKNGNRQDGFEKFGITDDTISPVMGCSGFGYNCIIKDYPETYASDMEKFKRLHEELRPGDVLEIMPTRSHGAGKAYIRYTGVHPEGEPENWFQFDAMETFGIISTFFTRKDKPVAVVSYASSVSNVDLKNFCKKVFELEEENFEPEDSVEKYLFEQHKAIAEETERKTGLVVVLGQESHLGSKNYINDEIF